MCCLRYPKRIGCWRLSATEEALSTTDSDKAPAHRDGASSSRWVLLAGLFLLALAPRLALALRLPSDDTVFVDRPYLELARNFSQGKGFWASGPYDGLELGRVYAYRPPLFPFLWGLVYSVTHGAYGPVRAAHAVISAFSCLVAYAIGRELFRDRRVAVLGAVAVALYPPLIWHSVHLMTEPLFIFFMTVAAWLLLRSRRESGYGSAVAAGIAAGLGTLTRSVLAGFVPVAGVWLWLARGRGPRALAAMAIFWAATGAVITPWVVRNAVIFGRFVPSTTDFGHGFYVANNAKSLDDPRGFHAPDSWAFIRKTPAEVPGELEVRRRLTAITLRFIRDNPAGYAKLVLSRLWTFWRPWPHAAFVSRSHVAIYGLSFVPAFLLMVPGLIWAWRRGPNRSGHALVLLLVLFMTGIHAMVLAMLRYRVPMMPILLMYSAFTVVALWDKLARGTPKGSFDEIAGAYDKALPSHVQDHYARKRARLLSGLGSRGICLDVGCGTGRLMSMTAGDGAVFGVDRSRGMLQVLRREGRGSAARAATDALPFADGSLDLVWCAAVLHHLPDPRRVAATIAEMLRVTRPGGHVVIWDHNPLNPYWPIVMGRVPQDVGTERLVPAAEIKGGLLLAGAEEWRLTRSGWVPDFAPRGLMWLLRIVEATLERTPGLSRLGAHNVFVIRR